MRLIWVSHMYCGGELSLASDSAPRLCVQLTIFHRINALGVEADNKALILSDFNERRTVDT